MQKRNQGIFPFNIFAAYVSIMWSMSEQETDMWTIWKAVKKWKENVLRSTENEEYLPESSTFKCDAGHVDCCCCRLLFPQPDFVNQKSHLEELITSHGYICDFYPKYHCELNFIEQYWGAVKLCYWSSPRTSDIQEMEENIKACLDDVSLIQIQQSVTLSPSLFFYSFSLRYANHAVRFINTYSQGASGPEAVWANRRYHRHRTLPPDVLAKLKTEFCALHSK